MNGASFQSRPYSSRTCGAGDLDRVAQAAIRWIFTDVLPLWASRGHDETHGGFFEQIALDGRALDLPKRCRVQARQMYSFIEAGRIGWTGHWRERADSGMDFMLAHHLRPDGFMRFKTHIDGSAYDESVDNYDQAFAIFALAHAYSVTPSEVCRQTALGILSSLRRERKHPLGGFHEGTPGVAPLLSNPHMHLLEAALAWLGVAPEPAWRELAQEIGQLCVGRLIDKETSALREYFEYDWTPKTGNSGRIIEPGHQFEWAWLLARWRDHGGAVDASVIRKLYEVADRHGVDHARRLTLRELWIDGGVKDAGARMWAQTERLKAALTMARLWPGERILHEQAAIDAWQGMQVFILAEAPGLFRDKLRADGAFVAEGALASSLYHIVCAVSELVRYANGDVKL